MMLPLLVDFCSKYGVAELLTYMGVNPRGARGARARNILAEGAQPLMMQARCIKIDAD